MYLSNITIQAKNRNLLEINVLKYHALLYAVYVELSFRFILF